MWWQDQARSGFFVLHHLLTAASMPDHQLVAGRGYVGSDLDVVMVSGLGTGLRSILVLALFASDAAATSSYAEPKLLGLACLPLLYWINRVWIMARLGEVDGDPLAFAIKDPRSIVLGLVIGAILIGAQQRIPLV